MLIEKENFEFLIPTLDYESRMCVQYREKTLEERLLKYEKDSEFRLPSAVVPFDLFKGAAAMARGVYEKFGQKEKLVLAVSGGLDSQAMLHAFLEAGVEFDVAVMRFSQRLNEHDIGHALNHLTSLGITPRIYDLDVRAFYADGEFMKYAHAGRTGSPQFAAHIWLAEQIKGCPIFAGEPWHCTGDQKENPASLSFYVPTYKEYGVEVALAQQGRVGISHFFESSMAWMQNVARLNPKWRYSNKADPFGSYEAKFHYYRQMGFPVALPAGLVKLTGFERLYSLTAAENGVYDYFYFNKIYREPLEKIFPPPNERRVHTIGIDGEFWAELKESFSSSINTR